jgi:hypothetical protein
MAKKIKKASQSSNALPVSKLYATAYGARLARQVGQQLGNARQASVPVKKKARTAGK